MAIGARINQSKYAVFRWRYELSIPKKLALAFGMAALTGLLAQVRVPNPLMPEIPITGQTFAVLLAAVFLGKWWGGASAWASSPGWALPDCPGSPAGPAA